MIHIISAKLDPPIIVVHGGAGSWKRAFNDPDYPFTLNDIMELIKKSLSQGYGVLESKNDSIEAVVESVKVLEDSGMLNAGWGSALNLVGEAEMDAGIAASNGIIGAVGAVKYPKNPIELAYLVATKTDHIIIVGKGADLLAEKHGLPQRNPPPDHVIKRYNRLMSELYQGKLTTIRWKKIRELAVKYGLLSDTVGAVAVNKEGLLAVASSTGGIWLKHPGRIGDTPVFGAGFYVDENVAVTATGYGEVILRANASLRVAHYYKMGLSLTEACRKTIIDAEEIGSKRVIGLIALSREGEVCIAYDTEGMPSGYMYAGGLKLVEF